MVNAKNKRDSRRNQDKKEKKLPSVSIVIVNYNGMKFLKDCLDSVFGLDYPKEKIEVIVVDNGSKDGSLKFISKNYPKVKLLKNDTNNYARANNLGIKKSHSEFVAILNNDTKVDKKWLIELVKRISKDKRIGGACSKVLLMNGRIDSAGITEFPNFYWQNRGYNEEDKGQYDRAQEVYALCGVSMLFRKKCLEEAGFEDEDFNIYVEEIDLAERCKKLGWKLVYCPKSVLLHHHGGTINENSETFTFLSERNRLYFVAKHFPEKFADAISTSHLFYKDIAVTHPLLFEKILPEAINKLVKEQGKEQLSKILPALYKKIFEISDFERYDLIRDSIDNKEKISSKEKEVELLQSKLGNLQSNLGQVVFERNKGFEQLNRIAEELERERKAHLEESYRLKKLAEEFERERKAHLEESYRLNSENEELTEENKKIAEELEVRNAELLSAKNEVARLKKEIYIFYHSRGYKLILGPIDRAYRFAYSFFTGKSRK
jgi:hypothetical protein